MPCGAITTERPTRLGVGGLRSAARAADAAHTVRTMARAANWHGPCTVLGADMRQPPRASGVMVDAHEYTVLETGVLQKTRFLVRSAATRFARCHASTI